MKIFKIEVHLGPKNAVFVKHFKKRAFIGWKLLDVEQLTTKEYCDKYDTNEELIRKHGHTEKDCRIALYDHDPVV